MDKNAAEGEEVEVVEEGKSAPGEVLASLHRAEGVEVSLELFLITPSRVGV